MHLKSVVSAETLAGRLLLVAAVFLGSISSISATPTDAVNHAVHAGGAAQVVDATPDQFLGAYTAVITRANPRQLAEYVSAAIQLRPDLTPQIAAFSINTAARNTKTQQLLAAVADGIVRAAILANPDNAVAVVRAAVGAAPSLRGRIVAAGIAAAPQLRLAILQATSGRAALASAFRATGSLGIFSAGFGNTTPSDSAELDGNVNSPEQAPQNP